jgi:hypothetical protein
MRDQDRPKAVPDQKYLSFGALLRNVTNQIQKALIQRHPTALVNDIADHIRREIDQCQ